MSGQVWSRCLHICWEGFGRESLPSLSLNKYSNILQGEIYVQFDSVDAAKKAVDGLNGRWFGGKQIFATFISDAIMQAHRWWLSKCLLLRRLWCRLYELFIRVWPILDSMPDGPEENATPSSILVFFVHDYGWNIYDHVVLYIHSFPFLFRCDSTQSFPPTMSYSLKYGKTMKLSFVYLFCMRYLRFSTGFCIIGAF